MTKDPICFFYEDTDFQLNQGKETAAWISDIINQEGFRLDKLNYIFCSDKFILDINRSYLQHDFYTDIITFPLSEEKGAIESDIYISVERVRENAKALKSSFQNELHRVMIHGVLHLIGYKDSKESEKKEMRKKEDLCLSLRDF